MRPSFFQEFRVNAHLRTASGGKTKGVPHRVFCQLVLLLAWLGKNRYRLLDAHSDQRFQQDPVYRFLPTASINWRSFLLRLSTHIATGALLPLVSRRLGWVLDTTSYQRPRSYDYAQKRFTSLRLAREFGVRILRCLSSPYHGGLGPLPQAGGSRPAQS